MPPTIEPCEPRRFLSIAGYEGAGKDATGGLGGTKYFVTNFADDANTPGTLRYGLEHLTGKKKLIIAFKRSGDVMLDGPLRIRRNNVTLTGRGRTVTIRNFETVVKGATNVVVEYLRFRPGDSHAQGAFSSSLYQGDSLSVDESTKVMINHVSASWSIDETLSVTDSDRVTVQWSIISESMKHSFHWTDDHSGYEDHGYGSLVRYGNGRVTFHHNLYAHHDSRNPRVGDDIQFQFVNNVVYDWGMQDGYSGAASEGSPTMNFVNNYYIAGPSTGSNRKGSAFMGGGTSTQVFQSGNLIDSNQNGTLDGTDTGWNMITGTYTQASRFPFAKVRTQSATDAYELVLTTAGASDRRDAVDQRIVDEVRNQTGGTIDSQTDVGGPA